jgi:hypothetical protein
MHTGIVVPAFVQLEDGFAGFEMVAYQDAGLFELSQHAVDGSQPDIHPLLQQHLIYVLRGQVPDIAGLEQIEDFEARKGGLQTDGLEVVGL